jgi:hypothetical protein
MALNAAFLVFAIGCGIFWAVFPERAAKRWAKRWTKRNYDDLSEQDKTQVHKLYRIFGIIFAIAATAFLVHLLTLIQT